MGLFTPPPNPDLDVKLARLERKLDAVMAHLGVEEGDDGMDDVRALIAVGKKLDAIKLYRERTGAGLAEAKAAIDSGLV